MRRREILIAATGAVVTAVSLAPRKPLASQATPSASPVAREADERFMRLALAEAVKGDVPFGAVIVRDGKVLARGFNTGKRDDDPTAHGEMNAIRAFLAEYDAADLHGTTLYTSGEPCAMCTGAIIWCGIGRIVFAASVEQLATRLGQIAISSQEIVDRETFAPIKITGGVLADEALALFP